MLRNLHFDLSLAFAFILLISIGVLLIYSATTVPNIFSNKDPYIYIKKELFFSFFAFIVMIVAYLTPIEFWKKYAYHITVITIILLILVLFFYVELKGKSVRRWLNLGIVRFQPSELAKFTIVLFFAKYISRKEKVLNSWYGIIVPLIVVSIFVYSILKEPHNGGAIFIALISILLMLSFNFDLKKIIPLFTIGAGLLAFSVYNVEYARYRLLAFLNPLEHRTDISYQIVQALISFVKGGWFGEGLGAGSQKFKYLPEIQTDYIFALIGEEFGVIGCIFILSIFLFILYKGIKISINLEDKFSQVLGVGITYVIVLQALLHFTVNLNIFPATGITLPFVSYGGTSLIIMSLMAGILLRLSKEPKKVFVLKKSRDRRRYVR